MRTAAEPRHHPAIAASPWYASVCDRARVSLPESTVAVPVRYEPATFPLSAYRS